ncbi:hypothetical protein KY46_15020 [Photobacterium halotolerans]|uniref:Uncharacterized protein n=1 Tax=Photobacterium halotolerans TaxID=265726 RepID=A0A0F5VAF5_9GAMM|nr:hypothetical protein KY46_15020 [Photobacterium halotolerans]
MSCCEKTHADTGTEPCATIPSAVGLHAGALFSQHNGLAQLAASSSASFPSYSLLFAATQPQSR